MTRTTLDLDGEVLRELRDRGRRERKSMGQVASELLAPALACGDNARGEQPPLRWISQHMGRPRIDLEDKQALGRVLDEEHLERLAR
jgi:hypothetical protein